MLTAPWLLRRGQHVRLDLVLTLVPARVAWLMEAVADLLGFAVCLVFVRYGFAMTYESWRLGSITIKNLVFPEWWLLAPLPVDVRAARDRVRVPLRSPARAASATRRIEATSVS